jgi:hypothetical protein
MSTQATSPSSDGVARAGSLREALDTRRARGERFSLREAIAILVPLATQLAELHAKGERLFVHPSAIDHGKAGSELDPALATELPKGDRDRACIAPEVRKASAPGDDRATVFALGAMLYELVTGESIGPGMRRPSEVVPSLPAQLEVVLGKALVADAKHRPHDVPALAQALHQLSPSASVAPPLADESQLDHGDDFEVDVSLSMLPPAPAAPSAPRAAAAPSAAAAGPASGRAPTSARDPFAVKVAAVKAPMVNPNDPAVKLATIKQRLESDPRPRYVVVKDGMDHGPFNAVELLQQIASHSFVGEHELRDELSGEQRPIEYWNDFSLFAQQARLHREMKQERVALEQVVQSEKQSSQMKVFVGVVVLGVIAAGAIGWWSIQRRTEASGREVREDKALVVDADAALSAGKDPGRPGGGGGRAGGGSAGGGSFPVVSGGGSCEAAIAKYTEDYSQKGVPADLSAGAYGNVLNKGGYLNSCGVPSSMSVSICAAVQNGRAVGVTVSTTPSNPGIASCVKQQVMGLGFPSHPRMDVARTTFAAQ